MISDNDCVIVKVGLADGFDDVLRRFYQHDNAARKWCGVNLRIPMTPQLGRDPPIVGGVMANSALSAIRLADAGGLASTIKGYRDQGVPPSVRAALDVADPRATAQGLYSDVIFVLEISPPVDAGADRDIEAIVRILTGDRILPGFQADVERGARSLNVDLSDHNGLTYTELVITTHREAELMRELWLSGGYSTALDYIDRMREGGSDVTELLAPDGRRTASFRWTTFDGHARAAVAEYRGGRRPGITNNLGAPRRYSNADWADF